MGVKLLVLMMLVSLTACSNEEKLPRLASDALILAYGDSITYGTGASTEESYPAVLEKLTGRKVVNAGVPGELSAEGLRRLPEILEHEKPALMILCHGGNDLLQHRDHNETAVNLRGMVELARQQGVTVVLVSVPAPDLSLSPPSFYRQVAQEFKIPCEEKALPKILGRGSLKSDYIHPNAAGYRVLADSLFSLLEKRGAL